MARKKNKLKLLLLAKSVQFHFLRVTPNHFSSFVARPLSSFQFILAGHKKGTEGPAKNELKLIGLTLKQ